uniref:ARAD1D04620p n=1 Tax=Blastobotrys adeninivorans TaxID=409370 RepID=A0A060TE32_BLAAD
MYQLRRKKNVKKVVPFTMMVVGTEGTGRTTFVNTLCNAPVLESSEVFDPSQAHVERPVQVKTYHAELEEDDGTRIALTVVDTPGFGDNIDNQACFKKIVEYLETQYDEVLAEESRIRRNPRFKDNRVHACLYFIEPTGHGLRELDIELMKRLAERVNVIPVIGRSDQLTPSELANAKKMTMEDIQHHEIPIYSFPYDNEEDDAETIQENTELKEMLPFAIVASTETVEIKGQRVRARKYPWGIVEVDNERHSDFLTVRSVLLGSHMADLKDITHDYLYENYRTEKLSSSVDNGRESRLLNPEDLANQSYILKEEQLAREEEKLREIELRVQKEINDKRLELTAREQELREIEARIARERSMEAESARLKTEPSEDGAAAEQQGDYHHDNDQGAEAAATNGENGHDDTTDESTNIKQEPE